MRIALLGAALGVLSACAERSDGRRPVAAESTVPLAESLPSTDKATPLLQHGAPSIDPALTEGNQLAGTSWQWLYLQTPVEKVAAPEPRNYVLTFGADGRISGKADCNRMIGSYQASARDVVLGSLATTRMMCPPGSLGDRFARDLSFVRSYSLHAPDTLRLDMQADGGTFTFLRAR
jgi:heat shock protein HslJ